MTPETKNQLKVFFLTLIPFPHGLAQTNRLISIAKGLISSGCEVHVICLKPTENDPNSRNHTSKGVYNGINYMYTSGTTYREDGTLRRIFLFLKGICLASALLIREAGRYKRGFIFIGIMNHALYLWFYIISRLVGYKYLQERSEFPFVKATRSIFDKFYLTFYLKVVCKLFDGFAVITRKLNDYFKPYLSKKCPVFHLPILVEPERFAVNDTLTSSEKYVAYCGSMQGDKDGVPDLIEAFRLLHDEFPEIKLYLIGSTDFEEYGSLKDQIRRLSLSKSVKFTGILGREELPLVLSGSVMLVLARPDNKQAQGGFPTKLGEYLATGKPVVVTNVGEICEYLIDNVHAFIARPNDPGNFAFRMKDVLKNYPRAMEIGSRGQFLAQTIFNSEYQGKQLKNWLNQL